MATPFSLDPTHMLQALESSADHGLNLNQVEERLKQYGLNQLEAKKPISKFTILIRQLKSIIVFLLVIASIISFSLKQNIEGFSVILVLIINTLMGYFTELKAVRSMESLKNLAKTTTNVLRDGIIQSIDSRNLVPGDILVLEAGDIIPADARIIELSRLAVDESILTGESVPVDKILSILPPETILAERTNMLYKGTSITRGSVKALVCATGMQTEVGKIAQLTMEAKDEVTPLEERLDKLGQQLVWVSLAISVFIVISGVIRGKELFVMLETALALAVAAIPEGLPIVATIALAKGMWRMANNNVLVNKLSVIETLGATSTIFTDKTGTLTENKMTVELIRNHSGDLLQESNDESNHDNFHDALRVAVLCNNGQFKGNNVELAIGDPMEIALLQFALPFGYSQEVLKSKFPRKEEIAFDSVRKMMGTIHLEEGNFFIAVKGAPESVLQNLIDHEEKLKWLKENEKLATEGLRVIALAGKRVSTLPHQLEKIDEDSIYSDLNFYGLIALIDPPRAGIKEALDQCHQAGIKVIMLTGDQEGTARKIAQEVHLSPETPIETMRGDEIPTKELWTNELKTKINDVHVFSRVSPQQKLDLIRYYQEKGQIVAMTGDGVNDAPALKKADIGMAMGIRGTQVAKEASDMILKDDHFKSIVEGIKEGRVIFSNIRRFVVYLLSCNLSEVLIVTIASLINTPMPLTALQILFLNLVTDVFPALALGMGKGDESYLNRPPRQADESIINSRKWMLILFYGLLITFSVLGIFSYHLFYLDQSLKLSVTLAFLTLGFAQVFHIFNMRLLGSHFIKNDITHNIFIWFAIIICSILLLGVATIPFFRDALGLASLNLELWLRVFGFSLLPVIIGQISMKLRWGLKN